MDLMRNHWKLWSIFGLAIAIALTSANWLYNHSYIEIVNNTSTDTEYTLVDAEKGTITSFSSPDTSIKKIVKKGHYEVTAKSSDGTFYQNFKTSGFLSTSVISVSLQSEKSRTFSGDNPSTCMSEVDGFVVSYDCQNSIESMKIHLPATDSLPTYTRKPPLNLRIGEVEGVVSTNEGKTVALVYDPNSEDIINKHSFYEISVINGEFRFNFINKATYLSPDTRYTFSFTGNRYLIHNTTYQEVFTGQSIDTIANFSDPLEYPADTYISDLLIGDLGYVFGYKIKNDDAKNSVQSELIYSSTRGIQKRTLNGNIQKIDFCQIDKICVLHEQRLVVFDSALEETGVYRDVLGFIENKDDLVVVKEDGALRVNSTEGTGSYDILFGQFGFGGIYPINQNEYLVTAQTSERAYALRINSSILESDFLDQKIVSLTDSSYVNTVSVYGQYIYISPELGEPVYDSDLNQFDYSSSLKSQAIDEIYSLIEQVGINQEKYFIRVTGI